MAKTAVWLHAPGSPNTDRYFKIGATIEATDFANNVSFYTVPTGKQLILQGAFGFRNTSIDKRFELVPYTGARDWAARAVVPPTATVAINGTSGPLVASGFLEDVPPGIEPVYINAGSTVSERFMQIGETLQATDFANNSTFYTVPNDKRLVLNGFMNWPNNAPADGETLFQGMTSGFDFHAPFIVPSGQVLKANVTSGVCVATGFLEDDT
ncbi:MAG: hypothetical protein AAF141_05860 [Pseudomonadota bacterium]